MWRVSPRFRRVAWGGWYAAFAFCFVLAMAYVSQTLGGSLTPVFLVLAVLVGFSFGYVGREYTRGRPPRAAVLTGAWLLWGVGAVWTLSQGFTTTFWVSLAGMVVISSIHLADWLRQRKNQPAV